MLLGYDWVNGVGTTVDYGQAMALARRYRATVGHQDDGSPSFTYIDGRGRKHEVWFEDARSVQAKVDLVRRYDIGGVFFWRLGGEDPAVWPTVVAPRRDPREVRAQGSDRPGRG